VRRTLNTRTITGEVVDLLLTPHDVPATYRTYGDTSPGMDKVGRRRELPPRAMQEQLPRRTSAGGFRLPACRRTRISLCIASARMLYMRPTRTWGGRTTHGAVVETYECRERHDVDSDRARAAISCLAPDVWHLPTRNV
jgi:hypothetical protein